MRTQTAATKCNKLKQDGSECHFSSSDAAAIANHMIKHHKFCLEYFEGHPDAVAPPSPSTSENRSTGIVNRFTGHTHKGDKNSVWTSVRCREEVQNCARAQNGEITLLRTEWDQYAGPPTLEPYSTMVIDVPNLVRAYVMPEVGRRTAERSIACLSCSAYGGAAE